MANKNFIVQNGLTVGPVTIDATTGNITTSGLLVSTSSTPTTLGNLILNGGVPSTSTTTGTLVVTGGIGVVGNITISGNLNVDGTQTVFNTNNATFADSLVYYANGNTSDLIDIGFVGSFNADTHTGLARDASDNGTWKLFANVSPEPTTTIDFTNAIYANLKLANLIADNISGTITTAAQPNITSLGTIATLSATTINSTTINASSVSPTAALQVSQNGYANVGSAFLSSGGNLAAFGTHSYYNGVNWVNADTTPGAMFQVSGATFNFYYSTGNATPVMTSMASLSGTGNLSTVGSIAINSGNYPTAILNNGTAGTGNIGNVTNGFNTVYAKATTAQYADLAELYLSDKKYDPATVVVFGGEQEITISRFTHDSSVAGVISTNPAHLMNSAIDGLPVALMGRVPCKVKGPISKGDLVVSSDLEGIGQKLEFNKFKQGCIIGKSLQDITTTTVEIIEVVVGRV